jgi:hypothetical protein
VRTAFNGSRAEISVFQDVEFQLELFQEELFQLDESQFAVEFQLLEFQLEAFQLELFHEELFQLEESQFEAIVEPERQVVLGAQTSAGTL